MQANAKSSLCDCAKSRIPDNADTKEGNTTNNITTAKGMRDHNFALVYPILKNNGICIPVIVEKTKNDKPDPSIISGALKIAFPHITKPRYRIIIATIPAR